MSKLTRNISVILLSRDVYLRDRQETMEAVDRVVRANSIKKSRVEELEQIEKNHAWCDEQKIFWYDLYCKTSTALLEAIEKNWRNRLWDAEQEIHDLKYELEKQRANAAELIAGQDIFIDQTVEDCNALEDENEKLILENQLLHEVLELLTRNLASKLFEQASVEPEHIEPPACPKPLDAF